MMEDNSKLFVFEKKEVVLIFVFIVVIAITAFTLGVRIGKQLSLKEDGYTSEEVKEAKEINLKSVEEEYVDSMTESAPSNFEGALKETEGADETALEVEARLREEMAKLAAGEVDTAGEEPDSKETTSGVAISEEAPAAVNEDQTIESYDELYAPSKDVKGKFTIQLYANQSKAAAEDFADPFIVKGYDVIINEAEIPGKGTWFRVSIGAFDTHEEAKKYLEKERALFQDEDYLIQQI